MKLSNHLQIGSKKVFVYDDFLLKYETKLFSQAASEAYFRKGMNSSKSDKYKMWNVVTKSMEHLDCFQRLHELVEKSFDREVTMFRNYIVHSSFGDVSNPHRDCPRGQKNITAVIYLNSKWHPDWGGETLYFKNKLESAYSVSVRPGRLSMFDAEIIHKVGIPARDCFESRHSLVVNFCPKENASIYLKNFAR